MFETCKTFLVSQKRTIAIYDVFRPIYQVSFLTGMTPFDVSGEEFKKNAFCTFWSIALATISTGLGMMDLVNRKFSNTMFFISDFTDFLLAWTNLVNDAAIMACGCVFSSKVGCSVLNR